MLSSLSYENLKKYPPRSNSCVGIVGSPIRTRRFWVPRLKPNRASPQLVTLAGATSLSAGASHTCATRANGTIMCWGEGTGGRLGNGATTDAASPVSASNLSDAVRKAYILQYAPEGAHVRLPDGSVVTQDDPQRQFRILDGQ